jgi:hypothetical protein
MVALFPRTGMLGENNKSGSWAEELGCKRCLARGCKIFHLDNSCAEAMMRVPSLRAHPGSYSFALVRYQITIKR